VCGVDACARGAGGPGDRRRESEKVRGEKIRLGAPVEEQVEERSAIRRDPNDLSVEDGALRPDDVDELGADAVERSERVPVAREKTCATPRKPSCFSS
jgi:hypothetical protein